MLIDMILRPVDTYWKKQFHAEEIKRRKAEADASYYRQEADYTNESNAILMDRDMKQSRAIEAYTKQVAELEQKLKERDFELANLREMLATERRASKAYQMAERLWESAKEVREVKV